MVNIPKTLDNKYFLIKVSTSNAFHSLMTENFIKSFENKFGRKNIQLISIDVDCFNENMFRSPKRFAKSFGKLFYRLIKDLNLFNEKKKVYYLNFNPFILKYRDLQEIIKLFKLREIDDNYSYLNIHIGDLINDSLQRFCWGDYFLFKGISKIFLLIYTFIILRQSIYFSKKLPNKDILYMGSSTNYSNNGIPFRVMSAKSRCTCYSTASINHTWLDFSEYTLFPYIDYKSLGIKLQQGKLFDLNEVEEIANNGLNKRTSGDDDKTLPYMIRSSFLGSESNKNIDFKNASILYLHDLLDASHQYPGFIFPNMVDYIYFTLNKLIKSKNKFFIKLHPNETISSKIIRKEIFKNLKIPKNIIIPANISNKQILQSNIKNVISAHGNIIIEAGYYGHFSIGASMGSPASSFENLLKIPKNKKEYELLLSKDFTKKNKKRIIYESKLAYFLLFHADLYLNDVDLIHTRQLYKEYRNNKSISSKPLYRFDFLR